MEKTLLLPGWMRTLKLYKRTDDFTIRIGNLDIKSASADYIIGLSLGALIALRDVNRIQGKIILINPPLPKRNLFAWFSQFVRYITNEGLFLERQKFTRNPFRYAVEIVNCIKLLRTDFATTLDTSPKDRLTIIRGKADRFFCDTIAANFIRSHGIHLIEVEGGHNWSLEIEEELNKLMGQR